MSTTIDTAPAETAPPTGPTPILGSAVEGVSSARTLPDAAAPSGTGAPAPVIEAPAESKPDPKLAELERRLAEQDRAIAAAKADATALLADRLGVLPQYRAYLPQVDPFTSDGKAALQKWASEHPEVVRAAAPAVTAIPSELEQKLTKAKGNPFVHVDAWRAAVAKRTGEVR